MPGGSTTVIARPIVQQLTEAWAQQVVVGNRPGANTLIVMSLAARAPTDGYTLVSMGAALAGNYWLAEAPHHVLKDSCRSLKVIHWSEIARIRSRQGFTEQMKVAWQRYVRARAESFPAFIL